MLKNETAQAVFLNLVRSILNNIKPSALPDGISADQIFEIGATQDMAPITFCALNAISPKPESSKWPEYQKKFLDDCMRSEIQMTEYHSLVEYLCKNGVKILPLKGCVIKDLYPSQNLRVMCDVDLLYEGVNELEIQKLMEANNYDTDTLELGCHDTFFKKPCMNIELHRKLISDKSPYRPVLENFFEKAVPDEKIQNLYHLTPENLYIHVIVHAAKHFKSSGLGIRPVCDIYVLNQKFKEKWNRKYIENQLESVKLLRFEEKIRNISYAFFGEEEKSMEESSIEEKELMLFFSGSTYGNQGDVLWEYALKGRKSRLTFYLEKLFKPYSFMREFYPKLRKYPFLLPFFWIYRIIDVLLHRRQRVSTIINAKFSNEDSENIKKLIDRFYLDEE